MESWVSFGGKEVYTNLSRVGDQNRGSDTEPCVWKLEILANAAAVPTMFEMNTKLLDLNIRETSAFLEAHKSWSV